MVFRFCLRGAFFRSAHPRWRQTCCCASKPRAPCRTCGARRDRRRTPPRLWPHPACRGHLSATIAGRGRAKGSFPCPQSGRPCARALSRRFDQQIKPAAIGQLLELFVGFGVADFGIGQRHCGRRRVATSLYSARRPRFYPQTCRLQAGASGQARTARSRKAAENRCFSNGSGQIRTSSEGDMVPLAGIEPALLAELDFESSASTNSATGARTGQNPAKARNIAKTNSTSIASRLKLAFFRSPAPQDRDGRPAGLASASKKDKAHPTDRSDPHVQETL